MSIPLQQPHHGFEYDVFTRALAVPVVADEEVHVTRRPTMQICFASFAGSSRVRSIAFS
jgi:hypothetical protein